MERAYAAVVEEIAGRQLDAGDSRGAVTRYQRLTELDPERESLHRALMRTYLRAGERALAVRQYHACRAVLRDRLGLEPSAETQALYRALLG